MQRLRAYFSAAAFYCICFCISVHFASEAVANTNLSAPPPYTAGETLHYKLSYRGLLTSMVWADLADLTMHVSNSQKIPGQQHVQQFELYLSTEHYSKAELFHPVRYTYTSLVDASLQRTVLVEETDTGTNQSHDFLWLDWENNTTALFKIREKIQQHTDFLGLESKTVWEKGGSYNISDFLQHFPWLQRQQLDIIYKEPGDKIEYSQILDPLSLIYALRTLSFSSDSDMSTEIPVAISDDIRLYQIQKQSVESFSLNGNTVQGTKFKIHTDEKKDNFYYAWLSNDAYKIPLRMAMDAPLGKLEIDLVKISR